MEYTIAKKHPLIGQAHILPACEELPPIGSKESENCVRLGIPNTVQVSHGMWSESITNIKFHSFLLDRILIQYTDKKFLSLNLIYFQI
jgi:hypothetical protein